MKVCLVGLDNLPVLVPEYREQTVGGESVQQTLLARALSRRGNEVCMVTADYGQADAAVWDEIRVYKAYRPEAGFRVLRFIHPRWSGMWSALARADAHVYYTSCAGMHVALLSLFCARYGRRFVFRAASDADCDRARLLVRYARDRWLYAYGLRRADAILVQSATQARLLAREFGMSSRIAGMLVEPAPPEGKRDIDLLWVGNIRRVKRPDRVLALAAGLPDAQIHMVGGPLPGEGALYDSIRRDATLSRNITFHGRMPYWDTNALYARARLLVNTSDIEGFPNSYLQAWIGGVPVITYLDPDGIIRRKGLGVAVGSPLEMLDVIRRLLADPSALAVASSRCRVYMTREFDEEKVLAPYLAAFHDALHNSNSASGIPAHYC
jgi:glycosyltransferase involved in cell wall biosynthesis